MGSRPSVAPARRRWSITVWLILVCCGVFVADALLTPSLPPQWVFMQQRPLVDVPTQGASLRETPVEPIAQRLPDGRALRTPRGSGEAAQYLLASVDGREVAVAERRFIGIPALQRWMYFSTSTALITWSSELGLRGLEFWRFITFQFCHANLSHLLFNMIALWFFGPIVEQTLGRRRFLAFYLTCGVSGALLYLLLNAGGVVALDWLGPDAKVPGVLINNPNMPLVGASAGIFGVLIAAARYVPNATVLLFFVIPMKLSTLAYGLVGIAVATIVFASVGLNIPIFSLPTDNAGGETAHLGGAIAGWYFARRPQHLGDFFAFLGRFDPFGGGRAETRARRRTAAQAAEVDRILGKVRDSGLASLTDAERRTLRDASER